MGTIQIQNEGCTGPSMKSPSAFPISAAFASLHWNGQMRLEGEVGVGEKQGTGIFSWIPPTSFHEASCREL